MPISYHCPRPPAGDVDLCPRYDAQSGADRETFRPGSYDRHLIDPSRECPQRDECSRAGRAAPMSLALFLPLPPPADELFEDRAGRGLVKTQLHRDWQDRAMDALWRQK